MVLDGVGYDEKSYSREEQMYAAIMQAQHSAARPHVSGGQLNGLLRGKPESNLSWNFTAKSKL
ncbi:hypothetical protein E2C01_061437 [Portunus trituberculatus]|uniref:Uncharacterized protein n=1 Tax=Portunus trituberculatus TaxID=210409 RepID=A0A5B7HF12_PORTR|nr:hypothetical protein [Portunus trituberculatus]